MAEIVLCAKTRKETSGTTYIDNAEATCGLLWRLKNGLKKEPADAKQIGIVGVRELQGDELS